MARTSTLLRLREQDRLARWRFDRSVARVAAVDRVIADYATNVCGRPYRRKDVGPLESAVELPGVTWTIDSEPLVEYFPPEKGRGPGRMVVHDIALLQPLKKRLRSRYFTIEHAPWA